MSKFWSPQGRNVMGESLYRLSAIVRVFAFAEEGDSWLTLQFADRETSLCYPTVEARDADYTRLIEALEAE